MQASPCAAPYPILSSMHKPRPHRVSFYIAAHGVKMLVALHGERLETSLVDVPFSFTVVGLLPATSMGGSQLVHERGQLIILFRPQNKVPVVGHQTIAKNPHGDDQQRFFHNPDECFVIGWFVEQCLAAVPTIQAMIRDPPWTATFSSRHFCVSPWQTRPQLHACARGHVTRCLLSVSMLYRENHNRHPQPLTVSRENTEKFLDSPIPLPSAKPAAKKRTRSRPVLTPRHFAPFAPRRMENVPGPFSHLELAAANRALLIDRAVADSQFLQSLVAVQRDFQVAEALEEPDAQSQRDVALANAEYDYAVLEAMAQADWKLAAVPAISWAIVSARQRCKVRWTIRPITESPMGRPWRTPSRAAFEALAGAAANNWTSGISAANTVYVTVVTNAIDAQTLAFGQADQYFINDMAGGYQAYQTHMTVAQYDYEVSMAAAQRDLDAGGTPEDYAADVAAALAAYSAETKVARDAFAVTAAVADGERRVACALATLSHAQVVGPAIVARAVQQGAAATAWTSAYTATQISATTSIANATAAYAVQKADSLLAAMDTFRTNYASPWATYTYDTVGAERDKVAIVARRHSGSGHCDRHGPGRGELGHGGG